MDGIQLRDEVVRDRIRAAEEFLDPSKYLPPFTPGLKGEGIANKPVADARARRYEETKAVGTVNGSGSNWDIVTERTLF